MNWTEEQLAEYIARQQGQVPRNTRKAMPLPSLALGVVPAVRALAQQHGWLGHQTQDAHGDTELLLVRNGECVVLLCKSARGKMAQEQVVWQSLLNSVPGIEARVCRPGDLAEVGTRLQAKVSM